MHLHTVIILLTSLMNLIFISETTSISGVPSQNCGSSFPPLYTLPTASGFSFVFGLLLGVILTVCIMKLQARRKALSVAEVQKHAPVQMPLYEELCIQLADLEHTSPGCKVVDNVAYGPMCN